MCKECPNNVPYSIDSTKTCCTWLMDLNSPMFFCYAEETSDYKECELYLEEENFNKDILSDRLEFMLGMKKE